MSNPVPTWIKVVLALNALVAVAILALGWSHTKGTRLGRDPVLADVVALASPLLLVAILGWLAVRLARAGKTGEAGLLALAPLPLALLLSMAAGMII